jgi:hypothetical protein
MMTSVLAATGQEKKIDEHGFSAVDRSPRSFSPVKSHATTDVFVKHSAQSTSQ